MVGRDSSKRLWKPPETSKYFLHYYTKASSVFVLMFACSHRGDARVKTFGIALVSHSTCRAGSVNVLMEKYWRKTERNKKRKEE